MNWATKLNTQSSFNRILLNLRKASTTIPGIRYRQYGIGSWSWTSWIGLLKRFRVYGGTGFKLWGLSFRFVGFRVIGLGLFVVEGLVPRDSNIFELRNIP